MTDGGMAIGALSFPTREASQKAYTFANTYFCHGEPLSVFHMTDPDYTKFALFVVSEDANVLVDALDKIMAAFRDVAEPMKEPVPAAVAKGLARRRIKQLALGNNAEAHHAYGAVVHEDGSLTPYTKEP